MYRVLVADDEPIERQVVNKKIMSFFPEQVEVFLAENGIEAVKTFEENDCQVAILDIEMPGMNGLDAAAAIREKNMYVSIIFLTAFDEFNYARRAITVRALDYLLKPGSDDDIINALEKAFHYCDLFEERKKLQDRESVSDSHKLPADGKEFSDRESDGTAEGTLSYEAEGGNPGRVDVSNTLVRDVRQYIDEHYKEDIALCDVASFLGYSEVYFCKIFKQNFGRNFIAYLNDYRIDRAKQLLENPAINIKDISSEAGYRDANYFTRVFKRIVGMTPSEYRQGALEK